MSVLVLVVIAGAAFYFMTPEERSRFFARAAGLLEKATDVVGMCRLRSQDPFYAYVRARVRWPLITYLLVAANVAVLVMMLFGPGALNDPATLVAWGGNFGPRTTDGERWRVVTSIFVHRNLLHLLVNMLALAQVGLIVERIVGPFTFATIFMAAGVLGSILAAAAAPLGVAVGATGGVFGVYGLLLAAAIRGTVQHSAFSMPPRLLKTLAPVAAVFVLYCVAAGEPPPMVRAGLGTGLIGGIALTRSVSDYRARLRRLGALGAATAAIVLMSALALRAVTDVRPTIASVVESEERTAQAYDAAVLRFRSGRATSRELGQIIDTTIVGEIERMRERVRALTDVPPADAPLVTDTLAYLQLRAEGWRMRAVALRKSSMRGLIEADKADRAALEIFARVRSAIAK